jgi:hypothetical protein
VATDANSLIRKALDWIEVVAEVRKQVQGVERRDDSRITSIEEHRKGKDLSHLSTEDLHDQLTVALAVIADVGEELARRSDERMGTGQIMSKSAVMDAGSPASSFRGDAD